MSGYTLNKRYIHNYVLYLYHETKNKLISGLRPMASFEPTRCTHNEHTINSLTCVPCGEESALTATLLSSSYRSSSNRCRPSKVSSSICPTARIERTTTSTTDTSFSVFNDACTKKNYFKYKKYINRVCSNEMKSFGNAK